MRTSKSFLRSIQTNRSQRWLFVSSILLSLIISNQSGCGLSKIGSKNSPEFTNEGASEKYNSVHGAAEFVRPKQHKTEFARLGVLKTGADKKSKQDKSSFKNKDFITAYKEASSVEVKATIMPGFARQKNYQAMPLVIEAIKGSSVILSGRAVATAESLLGVRYNVEMADLQKSRFRGEVAKMVTQDWKRLESYPRFAGGDASQGK